MAFTHDLIVLGANPTGLSIAAEARRSGVKRILLLGRMPTPTPDWAAELYGLTVRYEPGVERVEAIDEGGVDPAVFRQGRPQCAHDAPGDGG